MYKFEQLIRHSSDLRCNGCQDGDRLTWAGGRSPETVLHDWKLAKVWLLRELSVDNVK
jgi:hypothetical protein